MIFAGISKSGGEGSGGGGGDGGDGNGGDGGDGGDGEDNNNTTSPLHDGTAIKTGITTGYNNMSVATKNALNFFLSLFRMFSMQSQKAVQVSQSATAFLALQGSTTMCNHEHVA